VKSVAADVQPAQTFRNRASNATEYNARNKISADSHPRPPPISNRRPRGVNFTRDGVKPTRFGNGADAFQAEIDLAPAMLIVFPA